MLDDGQTMLGNCGLALKSIDARVNEMDKSTLIARYADGSEAILFPSVFDGETVLDNTKTIQDYMDIKKYRNIWLEILFFKKLHPKYTA